MFLLLFGIISLLEHICERTYKICLCALILFLTAANYWSLHNLVFIVLVIAMYFLWHENLCGYIKKCIHDIGDVIKQKKALTIFFAVTAIVWISLIGSIYIEQNGNLQRPGLDAEGGFSENEVFERALTANPSFWSIELFNPVVGSWQAEQNNYIHNARYIGIGVCVCSLLSIFYIKKKNIRLFWALSILMLLISSVPGFMLPIWKRTLSFDRHFFLFYAHFLEISLLLLSGGGLCEIVEGNNLRIDGKIKKTLMLIAFVASGIIVISFMIKKLPQTSQRSVMLMGILLVLSSGCLFLFKEYKNKKFIVLYLLVFLADITRYYYECSVQDYIFTEQFFPREFSRKSEVAKCFDGDEDNTFKQNIIELSPPLWNYLWPTNTYMPSLKSIDYANALKDSQYILEADTSIDQNSVLFYSDLKDYDGNTVFGSEERMTGEYTIVEYGYNDFTINVKTMQDGYILFGIPFDKLWKASIDGKRIDIECANVKYMYIFVEKGEHEIELHYYPFARRIYLGAIILVFVMLIICIWKKELNI